MDDFCSVQSLDKERIPREEVLRRKEMMNMPWYNNPAITSRVLNRIANRHPRTTLQDLNAALDYVTQMIWNKQEHYLKNAAVTRKD